MESWKKHIEQVDAVTYRIKKGFVPNMKVEGLTLPLISCIRNKGFTA